MKKEDARQLILTWYRSAHTHAPFSYAEKQVDAAIAALEEKPLAVVEVEEGHFLSIEQDGAPVFQRHIPGRYTMRQRPRQP